MPFRIFIDRQELIGWTGAKLRRSKADLTGSLSVDMFFTFIPDKPAFAEVTRGKEITVYVGGQLAFTGKLDRRVGKSVPNRDSRGRFTSGPSGGGEGVEYNSSISESSYNISLTARGSTKYLIDSSHRHPTTNILDTTNKKVIEQLLKEHNIELDWKASEINLKKAVLRDGAAIIDELHRVCNENAHYVFEGRDGRLIVTDTDLGETGDDLILGQNILSFNAEQSEDEANNEIVVKGHRSDPDVWGDTAVVGREKTVKDEWVNNSTPLVIQHYGDATDEALERRGKFVADKRATKSKRVTIDVFHVQSPSRRPWDIGVVHYVEVPPEGVYEELECTEIEYTVEASGTLKTTLTLTPPPSARVAGSARESLMTDNTKPKRQSRAAAREATAAWPDRWTSAELYITPTEPFIPPNNTVTSTSFTGTNKPPMTLPSSAKR